MLFSGHQVHLTIKRVQLESGISSKDSTGNGTLCTKRADQECEPRGAPWWAFFYTRKKTRLSKVFNYTEKVYRHFPAFVVAGWTGEPEPCEARGSPSVPLCRYGGKYTAVESFQLYRNCIQTLPAFCSPPEDLGGGANYTKEPLRCGIPKAEKPGLSVYLGRPEPPQERAVAAFTVYLV